MCNANVVIVSNNGMAIKGGVERIVGILHDELVNRKYKPEIFCEDSLPYWMRWRGSFLTFSLAASFVLLYRRHILRKNFIVISNSYFTPFFRADITIAHGSAVGYLNAAAEPNGLHLGLRVLALLERFTLRNSDCIICVSEAVRDLAITFYGVDANRCKVIYNGVEVNELSVSNKFSCSRYRLGYAGRMEYGKGKEYLIALATMISFQDDYEIHLAVIGEVPPLIKKLSNVYIYNDIPPSQMSEFYQKIDVFLLPSKFEGFELVTLEALAHGVCVLGFPVGACGALIKKGVPWVKVLPAEPEDIVKYGSKYMNEFKEAWEPILMQKLILKDFDIRRFTAEILDIVEALRS